MATDLTQVLSTDLGSWSSDPTKPNYASAAYRAQLPHWSLVNDLREGTPAIRGKASVYLPRFESETLEDWGARILMTFVKDHYAGTLQEHVGLVFATPPKLDDDVPEKLHAFLEDIDGEGDHWEVFLQSALDAALHWGHAVLFTDYPDTTGIKYKVQEEALQARPYVTLYPGCDVLNARYVTVGGVRVLVHVVFRETVTEPDGDFGAKSEERFRVIKQDVLRDEKTQHITGLGAITYQVWVKRGEDFALGEEGVITGPKRICARVVYGGEKIGLMHSRPHLVGLAYTNMEETQVESDYATVMHKCNVPTPVFIGRQKPVPGTPDTVQMGQGIDIPQGGDAKMLEPSGNAIGATRDRLSDLRAEMRRQGASMDDAAVNVKTAAEARMYAKQRNAKLARAARSLQDAGEGMLQDMATFAKIPMPTKGEGSAGGSLVVNQSFAGEGLDPSYLTVLVAAYKEKALPLDALLTALQTGKLPDEFSPEEAALKLIAEQLAAEEEARAAEQDRLDAMAEAGSQQPAKPDARTPPLPKEQP